MKNYKDFLDVVFQFSPIRHEERISLSSALDKRNFDLEIPPVGVLWRGEGGINGGFVPALEGIPEHYLIFAESDIGRFKWGNKEEQITAISKSDGVANTDILVAEGGHPAAEVARGYTADDHKDFHLPAAAQLYQAWTHGLISQGHFWSSSQYSTDSAFIMSFGEGEQYTTVKSHELFVLPVRRKFLDARGSRQ